MDVADVVDDLGLLTGNTGRNLSFDMFHHVGPNKSVHHQAVGGFDARMGQIMEPDCDGALEQLQHQRVEGRPHHLEDHLHG